MLPAALAGNCRRLQLTPVTNLLGASLFPVLQEGGKWFSTLGTGRDEAAGLAPGQAHAWGNSSQERSFAALPTRPSAAPVEPARLDDYPEPSQTWAGPSKGTVPLQGSQGNCHAPRNMAAPHQALPPVKLLFNDPEFVFKGRSTADLIRAYLVFRACGIQALVANSERLIDLSERLLGKTITYGTIKHTFFKHFCAGETEAEVQRTAAALRAQGVGGILDYAAEDDVAPGPDEQHTGSGASRGATTTSHSTAAAAAAANTSSSTSATTGAAPAGGAAAVAPATSLQVTREALGGQTMITSQVVARTYDYTSELNCDKHVEHFMHAVDMAGKTSGQGFAAVKVTALGNPQLLERMSTGVTHMHNLFKRFDDDGSGYIDRAEFDRHFTALLGRGSDELEVDRAFQYMDTLNNGRVDYVSWCQRLDVRYMPHYAARVLAHAGERESVLLSACLTDEEVALADAMMARLQRVVAAAATGNSVGLMIDAEHTYFQPAIDHVTLQLMRQHNTNGKAVIFHTYQAYLKDARCRLTRDLERAKREGWVLGAKLVRGAYLQLERRRAASLGQPSPCWDSLEETHASYAACLNDLLQATREGRAEVLVGSHNQQSIEQAVSGMAALGMKPGDRGVYFGQLLGMSDHLTFTLGQAGYSAFKYVPYGAVEQVVPYLLRRAIENADVLKGSKADLQLISAELKRRMSRPFTFLSSAAYSYSSPPSST